MPGLGNLGVQRLYAATDLLLGASVLDRPDFQLDLRGRCVDHGKDGAHLPHRVLRTMQPQIGVLHGDNWHTIGLTWENRVEAIGKVDETDLVVKIGISLQKAARPQIGDLDLALLRILGIEAVYHDYVVEPGTGLDLLYLRLRLQ